MVAVIGTQLVGQKKINDVQIQNGLETRRVSKLLNFRT